jgi:acyl-CoA thioester hydrolase
MSEVSGRTQIRVRYAETDQMGVVYHGNYFIWFEVGRVELLRQVGWSYKTLEADGVRLPVVEATCQYRHPARYDDELEIRTTGRMASPLRVEFTYALVRMSDGRELAVARTLHVPVNGDGRPCRLPVALREIFA